MASISSSSTDAKGKGKALEDILPQPLPPYASSSSTSPMVFLNHRRCEVKEGLATDIYHALNRMRRRVFLNQQVLEYGDSVPEEIEVAMSNASVCIAIFCPKYAQASWCLEELSFMVKNKKTIIPVFDNVEPSELRWVGTKVKGVYAEAFSEHEKKPRCTPQKLEEWKAALYNVSFFHGHKLKNEEDKGRQVKSIVESVLKHMPSPLEVNQHLLGLDEIVKDFENTAFKSSHREQHVDIVGIVGMGGSGKTTLAKELYNRKCFKIRRHSFISEVRDAADNNTLHNKQDKLLHELLFKSVIPIDNIAEGKQILRARLRSLRVLIVLDDVDHVDQIDALLPEKGCIFAAGSLIIVTTRESDVLRSFNMSCIYRMKPLNPIHAKHLFCWHAFMRYDPVGEFEDLVEKVMNACQGLPLSLKVLGAQLSGRPKDYWVSELDKILRILPNDIMERLKISFDALDGEQKEMFLDTACFFLGKEKSLAIEVWNGSGWSGLCDWETLLCKCLVELDQRNHICMHDHLRDMGRQIAMGRPPFRLFPAADLSIWRQAQERMPIRGIMETSSGRSSNWWYSAEYTGKPSLDYRPLFKEYIELESSNRGVQLLVAENIEFSEAYAIQSRELRWLRLVMFQNSCLPSWLSLENLRVLELYGAPNLEELWQDNMQQLPLQLRELIIHLRVNNRFQRFPESIGSLRHLKTLSCIGGGCVENLREGFCNLQSLEHLELQMLKHLSSLPNRFGDLTNLRHLDLEGCIELKMLPDSFKQLKHLEHLNLEGTSLTELPNSIGQLERLEMLIIGSTELESLPDSLGNLSSLTCLHIVGCKKLRSLPESLGGLALLEFILIMSSGVEVLPKAFGHLTSFQRLSIFDSPIRELIFEFEESSSLPRLKDIILQQTRISTLSIPEDFCPNLENLSVAGDDFLVEIRTLPRTVKDINLGNCKRLKDIACIGSLRNLQSMEIYECPELAELPSFAEFASIKEISIIDCQISGKMEGLEQVTSLETLDVHTQWKVPGITSLEHARGLRRLLLSADNTGAVEPCIKTLEKWPGEVIICARAFDGVESVVKVFTSSNLMVVEACADGAEETERKDEDDVDDEDDGDEESDEDRKPYLLVQKNFNGWRKWTLKDPRTCLSHEATIACFFLNGLSQDCMDDYYTKLGEGKWVCIRAVSQGMESSWEMSLRDSRVEKGLVGRGEEGEVKDVFCKVLEALKM